MILSSSAGNDPSGRSRLQTRAMLSGRAANLDNALERAAGLLKGARAPRILALTDMAGVNAALDLAEEIGASFDSSANGGIHRELRATEELGSYHTSRREVLARADVVLLAGARAANDRYIEQLKRKAPALSGKARSFLDVPIAKVSGRPSLKAGLASLAALASADRAPAFEDAAYDEPRAIVAKLQAARFGVAIWSHDELDVLEIAALMALIDKLNRTTRFTALPLRPGDNSFGGAQLCLSRWGVPPPALFTGGGARQMIFTAPAALDPTLDADLVLLASSFSDSPAFVPNVPVPAIAIGPNVMASLSPAVAIEAGILGKDHGGIWYDAYQDAYAYVDVPARSAKPSAAELLAEVLRKVRAA